MLAVARRGALIAIPALLLCLAADARAAIRAAEAARRVDRLLASETPSQVAEDAQDDAETVEPVPPADDETFLRRLSMDLIGENPSPEEIAAFALDPAEDKRARAVDRLLADPQFGQNWARYWRDVFLYRRSDERALIVSNSVVVYLTEHLNRGTPWDELARSFICATGNLREEGSTALIAAQWGETPEIASEVSRIFSGIQIQCAQCHDHKTDRWKRTQFHELAAFFPRVRIRNIRLEGQPRGFEVVSADFGPRNPKAIPGKPNRRAEHYMPDLEDAAAEGTLMTPVFFVTGQELPLGTPDGERRTQLAEWLTGPDNPWFAKAFVNRIWAEMVGQGFYEPIDDLGPDRDCSAPKTCELLAKQFEAHDYDVKWLFRTIALTEVYQRASRAESAAGSTLLAARCPQRLRGDQLFNALTAALGIGEPARSGREDRLPPAQRALRSPRAQFNLAFGFDPSEPREEISGSIPQALFLMNAPAISAALDADRQGTELAKLLGECSDNEQVAVELYLRCLAREPSQKELDTCLDYVEQVGERREAFEDIAWALLNTTEFLYRK